MKFTKNNNLVDQVSQAVGASRSVAVETVDFADKNRPKTCLEIDFPIIPVNQISIIETNTRKPIFTMSKWFAPRSSSAFRAILLAASIKAPEGSPELAAKTVWDAFYSNHQKKEALKQLKVIDIFMGGGTTVVEASRLGMQTFGVDLNPVAWFKVQHQLTHASLEEVKRLLMDIRQQVRPQIIPFFACNLPNGKQGKWKNKSTDKIMSEDFDPLSIPPDQRQDFEYDGPEFVYTFWAKHGPCRVTGCEHRTPLPNTPVVAVKTIAVKTWANQVCPNCAGTFDIENKNARMAPSVPLIVTPDEPAFAVLDQNNVTCPHCNHRSFPILKDPKNKKIDLTLLLHPDWLVGTSKLAPDGTEYGGSPHDDVQPTAQWNIQRARQLKLLEVRGKLPEQITCPETGKTFFTDLRGGTAPLKEKKDKTGTVVKDEQGNAVKVAERSSFACGAAGHPNDIMEAVKQTKKAAPLAAYVAQGYTNSPDADTSAYGGKFFLPFTEDLARQYNAAAKEWDERKETDLAAYWPRTEIPIGAEIGPHDVEGHHYTHWWTMFNPRQLLVLSQLLKAILEAGGDKYTWETRQFVLGAFQQYVRNQNMFCFWNIQADKLEPHYSKDNFHPKDTAIENCVFSEMGRGTWISATETLLDGLAWALDPWDLVSAEHLSEKHPTLAKSITTKSVKVNIKDPVNGAQIMQGSATDLSKFSNEYFDLVVTDPPFSDLIQYSELSDFFYVWLRLALKDRYPDIFSGQLTPKTLEVVANRSRQKKDPEAFYKRLLTESWREAFRILKAGGILAFTFHHDKDAPWVSVLESLFEAGFYLEATYPIRSDETKGDGDFGSQKVEYDMIHVCRKRTEEATEVSWAKMRKQVLEDVRQLASVLEHHQKEGLADADIRVIKRGKALEYFSRHYGKVFVDRDRPFSVRDALIGINQLLDEETSAIKDPPPVNAEPLTRQLLRLFDGRNELPRDQMHKYLRGTTIAPSEFEQKGWCEERNKVFALIPPITVAQRWYGRQRKNMVHDYDQALFLIGACFENSGINAADTLKNDNFQPHPALESLLEWHIKKSPQQETRQAATRALQIFRQWYRQWERSHPDEVKQLSLFKDQ